VQLNDYLAQLRDILHDPNANNWTNTQLTRYINNGRKRVAQDTKCLRQVITSIPLVVGQEQYDVSPTSTLFGPTYSGRNIDVMEIDFYWSSTTQYPLAYLPWTILNTRYRYFRTLQTRCEAWTRMGSLSVYIAPIPDQAYNTDWVIAINPNLLIDNTTVEELPPPFDEPVCYWAAYEAKFGEQALGEAKIFKDEYISRRNIVQRSFMTMINPDPYANA
jgi:hypothetical protein